MSGVKMWEDKFGRLWVRCSFCGHKTFFVNSLIDDDFSYRGCFNRFVKFHESKKCVCEEDVKTGQCPCEYKEFCKKWNMFAEMLGIGCEPVDADAIWLLE